MCGLMHKLKAPRHSGAHTHDCPEHHVETIFDTPDHHATNAFDIQWDGSKPRQHGIIFIYLTANDDDDIVHDVMPLSALLCPPTTHKREGTYSTSYGTESVVSLHIIATNSSIYHKDGPEGSIHNGICWGFGVEVCCFKHCSISLNL